jgi:hypothetical protein
MKIIRVLRRRECELWGISDRRVQALCVNGQVDGAIRLGRGWLIPKITKKPLDGRAKNGRKPQSHKQEKEHE